MKLFVVVALLAACGKHPGTKDKLDVEAARGVFEEVPIDAPPGMSDLTIDDRGVMWAIAERDRKVLEIELGKSPNPSPGSAGARSTAEAVRRVIVHPLEGVPDGIDTEGIAWLGDGRFAVGTEGADLPTASIMFAELHLEHLMVTRTRTLTSQEIGVQLAVNHGVEAVCGRGDELIAAIESVGVLPDGTRYAPLVRLRGDTLTVTKLKLTTSAGKISALYCTWGLDGSADVIAIERHYGVSRLLHFTASRGDLEITPKVELDLNPILHDALNLEGIVRLPDGRLVAINDNQGARVEGRTELLVFSKR